MKKTLFACLLTFYTQAVLAQTGPTPTIVHSQERAAIHVPSPKAPAGLKKIYSNLGRKLELYDEGRYATISGPNSSEAQFFLAMPFTPKSDSHVSQVGVAVQYISGANQVNVSIYASSGGAPGTLLAGPVTVTNLPTYPNCCELPPANFSSVAVTGGTQYWIVVNTPLTGTGSDFLGAWVMVVKPYVPLAFSFNGNPWTSENVYDLVAGEVLGTIP
jgi:hypothetical protein